MTDFVSLDLAVKLRKVGLMSDEIRGTWKQKLLGQIAGRLMQVYGWLLRYEIKGLEGHYLTESSEEVPRAVILVLWHNRIFGMLYLRREILGQRPAVVLTSASKDGTILENAVKVFGLGAVRGSSRRRGAKALAELRRAMKKGTSVVITPDGPKGPLYGLQPGVLKLAQAAQEPIVVLTVRYEKHWKCNSWDQFQLPWPLSKVEVIVEPAMEVAAELNEVTFEETRQKLEDEMKMKATERD